MSHQNLHPLYKCQHCGGKFLQSKMAAGLQVCKACAKEVPL